jgi:hypothetical protein
MCSEYNWDSTFCFITSTNPTNWVFVQKPTVIVNQPMVTFPQLVVMVQHQPKSAPWAPQTQNFPTVPCQPYVGKIHRPLVDISSPPVREGILYGVKHQ